MNYYQTAWILFGLADVFFTSSVRIISRKTGISKSSVQRFRTAFKRRQKFSESPIWETEEGMKWLVRLVIASIYQFGLKGGVGSPTLKGFFDLIHISTRLGLSASSVERIRNKIIEEIICFGEEQIENCKNSDEVVELILGADETWLEDMTLVLMDLSSGFIFLEKSAKKRDFKTWSEMASDALSGFPCKVLCLVSDRARSLIKLANDHLHCPSVADLFHILNDLNKEFALSIHWRLEDAKKKLITSKLSLELLLNQQIWGNLSEIQNTVEIQKEKLDKMKAVETSWLQTMKDCSLCVHPFESYESRPQKSQEAIAKFQKTIQTFENVINTNEIPDRKNTFSKVRKQINDVCQSIDIWWRGIEGSLDRARLHDADREVLKTTLLPYIYWGIQHKKSRSSALKSLYKELESKAYSRWETKGINCFSEENSRAEWVDWAKKQVNKFQRTSSAVEGRNGYLSMDLKNKRHLKEKTLEALTVIHNFDIRGEDHYTPVERLFGSEFPNLFESILSKFDELPRPRQRKRQMSFTPPNIGVVPP